MLYSPLEQFEIVPLFSFIVGSKLAFTNSSLFVLLTIFVIACFFHVSTFESTLAPNRWQTTSEMIYEFVQGMLHEALGGKGSRFFPFIFTTFVFIFFANVLGMVPYTFTVTSHLIFTFALGMTTFVSLNIIGFKIHGLHFFSLFLPPGAPLALAPLLVPIELISYVFRVVALAVRLFANMMAGHTLVKILSGFAWTMLSVGGVLAVASFIPFAIVFALTGLEIGVACLQAYVFTILTCIYLNDAINLH
jgi:ATP synthase subunit 6